MKNIILISFLFLYIAKFNFAQQWIEKQEEVRRTAQNYSYLWNSNNLAEFYNYFAGSYWAWDYSGVALLGKSAAAKTNGYWATPQKGVSYFIALNKVRFNGNFAYVDFIYKKICDENGEKVISKVGHYTDVLIKENEKWLIVADHSGETE